MKNVTESLLAALVLIVILALVVAVPLWGVPQYRVYNATMRGKAMLSEAEFSKQSMVEQARAERDSAALQAEAIKILGAAAKEYPEYREQMFLTAYGNAVENGSVKMIFVPTEANVPILVNPQD